MKFKFILMVCIAAMVGCGHSQSRKPVAVPVVAEVRTDQAPDQSADTHNVVRASIKVGTRVVEISFDTPVTLVLESCDDNDQEAVRQFDCLYRREGGRKLEVHRFDKSAFASVFYEYATVATTIDRAD